MAEIHLPLDVVRVSTASAPKLIESHYAVSNAGCCALVHIFRARLLNASQRGRQTYVCCMRGGCCVGARTSDAFDGNRKCLATTNAQ